MKEDQALEEDSNIIETLLGIEPQLPMYKMEETKKKQI